MENNRIYPPRRVMVSKPFIIEKSSIFFQKKSRVKILGNLRWWHFGTQKNERTVYISDLLKKYSQRHAGRDCILKTGLTEIGNDKGRAWIVTEGSEIKSFFFADFM